MKKILMIILLVILLVGCDATKNVFKKESDAILFKEEYESLNDKKDYNDNKYRVLELDEDNPFIYKDISDILEMIDNKETFAVYFGFASCPWCRSIVTNLIDVSNNLGIETIYYVDIEEVRDLLSLDEDGNIVTKERGCKDYYKLLEKLETVLDDYILIDENGNEVNTLEKRIYAPNIVSIVDGDAKRMTTGISDKQVDAYMELTDEVKTESYDKIKCTIECIVEEKAVCAIDKKC